MGYYLEDILTGEKLPAVIGRLSSEEIALLDSSNRFDFEWKRQLQFEIYGLRREHMEEVIGLVSLESQPKNLAIEIKLIANAREHLGSKKRYDRIAGNLIAFVCKKSFDLNFDGYVYLKPKTSIIFHYRQKYGFSDAGNCLFLDTYNSRNIINEYHEAFNEERPADD
ncbi:hypothetical protein SAMN05216327_105385 [Dyadobacter sp. SG02]|uniref:hypothetical protein n=1 Tax=Dyadobacter sp. SG02 TaxID=1855291 RepID=UPI0008BD89AA|nr:hypothetical protein [Dyadobacter sp. SG02]SEJ03403.1 hypothetical protein SAMN05216327_105385 [Dyadobacter sp. SG02]